MRTALHFCDSKVHVIVDMTFDNIRLANVSRPRHIMMLYFLKLGLRPLLQLKT